MIVLWMVFATASNTSIADANECEDPIPVGHGNATSQEKAKRNARISLERNLNRAYPGDSKRYLRNGIEYNCKNSVLWLCKAKVKVCG